MNATSLMDFASAKINNNNNGERKQNEKKEKRKTKGGGVERSFPMCV